MAYLRLDIVTQTLQLTQKKLAESDEDGVTIDMMKLFFQTSMEIIGTAGMS